MNWFFLTNKAGIFPSTFPPAINQSENLSGKKIILSSSHSRFSKSNRFSSDVHAEIVRRNSAHITTSALLYCSTFRSRWRGNIFSITHPVCEPWERKQITSNGSWHRSKLLYFKITPICVPYKRSPSKKGNHISPIRVSFLFPSSFYGEKRPESYLILLNDGEEKREERIFTRAQVFSRPISACPTKKFLFRK